MGIRRGRPVGTMDPVNQVILESFPKLRHPESMHTWGEIARIFGVTRDRVLGIAHRHGWCKSQEDEPEAKSHALRQPSPPRRFVPKEDRHESQ